MGALVFSLYAASEAFDSREIGNCKFFIKGTALGKENERPIGKPSSLAALAAYNVYHHWR